MKRQLTLLLAAALLPPVTSYAEDPVPGKQVEQTWESPRDQKIPYLFYLPKGLDKKDAKKWPLILFLHGRGESRGPLSIVAKWGPPRMAEEGVDLKYIVVSPQCPASTRWTADDQQRGVIDLLDHVIANYPVDATRIYLTGLSMGGYGSWKLAASHPKRFAAAAPICGGGDPSNAKKLLDLPLWVFHGDADKVVPYRNSVAMVEAIKKAGGKKIKFTTYKDVGHNSWSATYANPELFKWFDKHRREE